MDSGQKYAFGVTSILNTKVFSWVFLVDWIMIITVILFLVFYSSRLVAWVITQALGWFLWHRYRIFFKFSSFKISLLGGRIFFKNLVYIGDNEAFSILQGHITWQYWIAHARKSDILITEGCGVDPVKNEKLPAQIELTLEGFEWFVYNRGSIYEELATKAQEAANSSVSMTETDETARDSSNPEHQQPGFDATRITPTTSDSSENLKGTALLTKDLTFFEQKFIGLLPVKITLNNASIIAGNEQTQSLMVGRTKSASAVLDLAKASNEYDRYMFRFLLSARKPVFELVPNYDYAGEAGLLSRASMKLRPDRRQWYKLWKLGNKRKDGERVTEPWTGLSRYNSTLNDQDGDNDSDSEEIEEYAKVSTFLEADHMELDYHYDVPGPVVAVNVVSDKEGNGSTDSQVPDPVFGSNIRFKRATINYGPWTERQRIEFYALFFPRSCVDAAPRQDPSPGELRRYSETKSFIEFEGPCVMRIPVREFSKNAEFMKLYGQSKSKMIRSYGWLEVTASSGSTISTANAMVPNADDQWWMDVIVDLKRPELSSSVNHGVLLDADSHTISCRATSPLKWNGLVTWTIDHHMKNLRQFLLREHVSLITDTILDFATGPPVPYSMYTPAHYHSTWNIENFALFFNVNAQNIINSPTSLAENTFLVLRANTVKINLFVPLDQVAIISNTIKLRITAPLVTLELSAPSWHTLESFLESPIIARVDNFVMEETHLFHADPNLPKPENQKFNISGENYTMICHGFLIDYLMTWRENYFGHKFHFQTTEEFLSKDLDAPEEEIYTWIRTNDPDIDSLIDCNVKRAAFVFPGYLYSARDNLSLNVDELSVVCRFTNYYMDLQAHFSPVNGFVNRGLNVEQVLDLARVQTAPKALFISEVNANAHRMFGLPPAEPTYNVRWDFDIDHVFIDTDISFISLMEQIGTCAGHSIADLENKPVLTPPTLYDITFLTANISSVHATLHAEDDIDLVIKTSFLRIKFNDFANERYSDHVTVDVPSVKALIREKGTAILEVSTALRSTIFINKVNSKAHYDAQQDHIMLHDSLFHRCPYILDDAHRTSETYHMNKSETPHIVPTLPLPKFPPQLTRETAPLLEPRIDVLDAEPLGNNGPPSTVLGTDGYSYTDISLYGSDEEESEVESMFYSVSSEFGSVQESQTTQETENTKETKERYVLEDSYYLPSKEWIDTSDMSYSEVRKPSAKSLPWSRNGPCFPIEEEDREYISFVYEVEPIKIVASTKAIPAATKIIDGVDTTDMEAIFDKLQTELVDTLVGTKMKECKRLNLVISSVELIFGELAENPEADQVKLLRNVIYVTVQNFSYLFQSFSDPEAPHARGVLQDDDHAVVERCNGRARFESLVLGVRRADRPDGTPFLVQLARNSMWFHKDSKTGITAETSIGNMDAFCLAEEAAWLSEYALSLASRISFAKKKHSNLPNYQAPAVLAIAELGESHKIDDDSYVLSRPSGAVQSSNHVRSAVSWRIVVRLRYLLQKLPSESLRAVENRFKSGDGALPEDAFARVERIFRNWRSWEHHNMLGRAKIFDMFDEKEPALGVIFKLNFSLESLGVRLGYANLNEDYIVFDNLSLWAASKRHTLEVTKFELFPTCSKIRVHLSKDLAPVIRRVKISLANAEKVTFDTSEPKELDPPKSSDDEVIQTLVTLIVQDFSAEFVSDTLAIELQNHAVKISSVFEYHPKVSKRFFSSGVLQSSTAAVRVFNPNSHFELGDYLVDTLFVGFATRGFPGTGSTWVNIDVEGLSLAMSATVVDGAKALELFLQKDLGELLEAVKDSDDGGPISPVSSEKEVSSVSTGRTHVDINIGTVNLKFKPFAKLQVSLTGYNLNSKFRSPDAVGMLASFDLDSHVLTLTYDEHAKLGSFVIEGLKTLVRADNGVRAVDIIGDINRLRLETISVLRILEFIKLSNMISQFNEAEAAIDRLHEAKLSVLPESSSPTPISNVLFKLRANINETLVTLPMDSSSFRLSINSFSCKYDGFSWNLSENNAERLSEPIIVGPTMASAQFSEFTLSLVQEFKVQEVVCFQLATSYDQKRTEISLYLTCDFFRISLDPHVAGAIAFAAYKIEAYGQDFASRLSQQPKVPKAVPKIVPKVAKDPDDCTTSPSLSSLKAAIALSKFSIAWHTGSDGVDREGVAIGYELLQINLAKLRARMDLKGFFVAPARALSSEKIQDQLNTAYLPHVELIGVLAKDDPANKMVYLQLKGQSLRIDLSPVIAPLIAGVAHSFDVTQELIEKLPRAPVKSADATLSSVSSEDVLKLTNGYSFHIKSQFDTAVVRLWEEADYGSRARLHGQEPSLELHSPAVDFVTEFICAENGRDNVFLSVNVSRSSNILFPRALVEVKNIYHYTMQILEERRMRRRTKYSTRPSARRPSISDQAVPILSGLQNDDGVQKLLSRLAINVEVHFGPQELSLSSMPYSKIAATASTPRIDIYCNTPLDENGHSYVALTALLLDSRISLQHMYSRETSGFIGMKRLLVTAIHKSSGKLQENPLQIGIKIDEPRFELKASQMYDVKLFKDIWLEGAAMSDALRSRFSSPAKSQSPEISAVLDVTETFADRYKKAVATVPMPWSFNVTITDISGTIDMGQSVTKCDIHIRKTWLAAFKTSHFEQLLALGVDFARFRFEGRVGGMIEVGDLRTRVSAHWSEANQLPSIQASLALAKLSGYVSLDYHPFFAVMVKELQIALGNNRENLSSLNHLMLLAVSCDDIWIVSTALVVSNMLDVGSLLESVDLRTGTSMFGEEASKPDVDKNAPIKNAIKHATREIMTRIRVSLALRLGTLQMFIFPTEFTDNVAIRIAATDISAQFTQKHSNILESEVDLRTYQYNFSIMNIKQTRDEAMMDLVTEAFIRFLDSKGSSTTIVNIPHFKVLMKTYDMRGEGKNSVEFTFTSSFDGRVEVGWNLGAINFVREMTETHRQALDARELIRTRSTKSCSNKTAPAPTPMIIHDDWPEYIALEPPIISVPQLHDMGEATPPVEWVGLKREKLPGAIHWYCIRVLNEFVKEMETVYEELLGRA